MCLPFLAAIPAAISSAAGTIGTVTSLIGTGLSAVGSIAQGNAAKAQADAQAKALNQQASTTVQAGEYQAARKQDEIDQTMGTQIAMGGASGFDLTGSPSDAIASTASQGALDTEAIRWNAKSQAQNLNYQANLTRQSGSQAKTAGYIGAFSNVVGGLGGAFSDYQRVNLMKRGYQS